MDSVVSIYVASLAVHVVRIVVFFPARALVVMQVRQALPRVFEVTARVEYSIE